MNLSHSQMVARHKAELIAMIEETARTAPSVVEGAKMMGVHRRTFQRWLQDFGIECKKGPQGRVKK